MSTKHTPGPWGYEDPMGPEILTIVANPKAEVYDWIWVAQISTSKEDGDKRSLKEHEANARLIAAAPELLASIIECRKQIDTIIEDGTPTDWHMWRDDLDALIAKATS